jgi:hypothetical protein
MDANPFLRDWQLGVVGTEPTLLLSVQIQHCYCWRVGNVFVIIGEWRHIPCRASTSRGHQSRAGGICAVHVGLLELHNCCRCQGMHTLLLLPAPVPGFTSSSKASVL